MHRLEESRRNPWEELRGGIPPLSPVFASVPNSILLGKAGRGGATSIMCFTFWIYISWLHDVVTV